MNSIQHILPILQNKTLETLEHESELRQNTEMARVKAGMKARGEKTYACLVWFVLTYYVSYTLVSEIWRFSVQRI